MHPVLYLLRYIEENYTKIRDVERELTNLSLEMKLTSGPKKAGPFSCHYLFPVEYLSPI